MSDIKTVVKSSGVSQTFEKEKLFTIVEKTLAFCNEHGRPGERFRHTLDRVGWEPLKQELTEES